MKSLDLFRNRSPFHPCLATQTWDPFAPTEQLEQLRVEGCERPSYPSTRPKQVARLVLIRSGRAASKESLVRDLFFLAISFISIPTTIQSAAALRESDMSNTCTTAQTPIITPEKFPEKVTIEHVQSFKQQLQTRCQQEPRLVQTEKTLQDLLAGVNPPHVLELIHEILTITLSVHFPDVTTPQIDRETALQQILKLGFKFSKTTQLIISLAETILFGPEAAEKLAAAYEQQLLQKRMHHKKLLHEQKAARAHKIPEIKTPSPKPIDGKKHVHYDETKHFIPIPAASKSPEATSPEPVAEGIENKTH